MLKELKKLLVVFLVMTLTLIQLSNLIYAINENITTTAWNTAPNQIVNLGLSFKQPDNKYYKMNYAENGGSGSSKSRAIYRTYYSENSGSSTQDYSKNIFCLDIDGKFPNETSTSGVYSSDVGPTAQYKSVGEVTANTQSISITNNKTINNDSIKKVLAIVNSGYEYTTFQTDTQVASWLDKVMSNWEDADNNPSGDELLRDGTITKEKIFLLEQIAVWEVTNNIRLQNNLFMATSSPNDTQDAHWNTENAEYKRLCEPAILGYFRKIAENPTSYLPQSKNAATFDKSTKKTCTVKSTYTYIGPFKLNNTANLSEAKVYGVKGTQETEIVNGSYKVFKDNNGSQSVAGIKQTNGSEFYIRVATTLANTYDSIKIKVKTNARKMTLWEKTTGASDSQKLLSMTQEVEEDLDTAAIVKPKYDVALRKYIVKVNNTDVNGENSREPQVTQSTSADKFNQEDFQYKHRKDPITVKPGDKVTYRIQVYNECDNKLIVKSIKDYLPNGLELDTSTTQSNWTASNNNGEKCAVYNGSDLSLNPIEMKNGTKNVHSMHVDIVCRVTNDVTVDRILTNVAEITNVTDENGHTITKNDLEDDSTGGDLSTETKKCDDGYKGKSEETNLENKNHYFYGEEDDDDFEKLKVVVDGKYKIDLEKIDGSGKTIIDGQAQFKITEQGKTGETKTTTRGKVILVDNKEITSANSQDVYTVEEISAPNGYNKTASTLTLTVYKKQQGSEYVIEKVEVRTNGSDSVLKTVMPNGQETVGEYTVSLSGNTILIKVKNEKIEGVYNLDLQKVDDFGRIISTSEATFNINEQPKTTQNGVLKIAENKAIENVGTADEYTIEETKAPDNYKIFNKKLKLKVNKALNDGKYEITSVDISFEDGDTINITNGKGDQLELYKVSLKDNVISVILVNEKVEGKYDVNLEKVDENGELITSGEANFKVNDKNENSTTGGRLEIAKDIEITDTNSKDQYIIEETKAPEGYEKIAGKLTLTISKIEEDGVFKLSNIDLLVEGESETVSVSLGDTKTIGNYEVTLQDGLITIKVKNKKIEEKKIFDLALKKFITKVMTPNGDGTYEEQSYNNRCRPADGTPLNSSNDAKYDLDKDVIRVKTGDTVIYTIRIFNEGDIDGTATIVADDLPEGLEFIPYSVDDNGNFISGSELNHRYGWKVITDSDNEHWKSGIYTEYLKDKIIKAYDKGTNTLSYEDIQVELKVVGTKPEVIKNIAEILEDTDDDRDSTPKDEVETEDDEDYDNIIPGEPGKFDLSLQKFITKVDEKEITERTPSVTYENGKLKFAHPQDAVTVVNGNKVTYTIRLYNEGDIAGFPSVVKDDLPNGIRFLKDSDTNKKYDWKMYKESENGTVSFGGKKYEEVTDVEDAEIIATDYYSYEKAKARGESAIEPFDNSKEISDKNPDYRDLKVEFEVVEKGIPAKNRIIINTAEIAEDEDKDGNPIEDIDSTPNNDKDEEDDIDKERLQLKYFDLSLLKYVSEVEVTEDGKKKTIKTGYNGTENPEPMVKVEINRKKLNKTEVKYTFTIKITNEGEIEGYATEITDYIPSGLEFYEKDNTKYKWKAKDGSKNVVTTDYLKDTLLKPGESTTIKIVLRWKKSEKNLGQKINTAEISEDKNEYNVPDIDSTPNNKRDGEDDIDDAPVILSIATGGTQLYVILIITVLTILSTGGYLIYKYVYCYQEEKMLINNIYKTYTYRKRF